MYRKQHYLNRIICILLSVLVLGAPLAAAAGEQGMTASRSIIDFIEGHEGYSQYQYGDSGGYSIGYGTNCDYNEFPDGVSRYEAELMLLEHLEIIEKKLNAVMELRSLTLTQNEFDALISFSYNLGTAWMDTSVRLYSYILSGTHNYTESEFASAMGIWCHIGSEVGEGLIKRRIEEIKIFLYGDYEGTSSPDFVWLVYDPAGGEIECDVELFKRGESYGQLAEPVREGYSFNGWYTGDGEQIMSFQSAEESATVYAAWTAGESAAPSGGEDGTDNGGTVTDPGLRDYYDSLIDFSGWTNPFSDIKANAWYYKYVGALTKASVVSGYPDGTFRPDGSVTCAEALVLVLNAAGYGVQTPTGSHWASGYLSLAESRGILSYDDISDLDAKISRRLIAKLAARALGIQGSDNASPFTDTADTYAIALYENGVISGSYAGTELVFLPDSYTTRGQVSVIVWNMMLAMLDSGGGTDGDDDSDGSFAGGIGDYIDFMGHTIAVDKTLALSGYDSGDFIKTRDGRLLCAASNVRAGIDVSSWQGAIDWEAVADDGIDFAIIRVGYRGYTEGGLYIDPYFIRNIEGALAAGLDVGVYFYSQAVSAEEAAEEARVTLEAIAGYNLTYPVVFDWEPVSDPDSRTNTYDNDVLTVCAQTFCDMIKAGGYTPSVYFNCTLGYLKYDLGRLTDYDFWLAEYKDAPTFIYDVEMWQYSSSVMVEGIGRTVDVNLCFKRYA